MTNNPTSPPDSMVYVLLDTCEAPPVKVPVVAFAAVTEAEPVAFSRTVLFAAFEVVMRVAGFVVEVSGLVVTWVARRVVGFVSAVVDVNGLVVVIKITGSVSDLLVVIRVGLTVVLLALSVTAVCEDILAWVRDGMA